MRENIFIENSSFLYRKVREKLSRDLVENYKSAGNVKEIFSNVSFLMYSQVSHVIRPGQFS